MEVQETRIPEKEEEKKNEQKLEEQKIIRTIFKVNKNLGDPYFRKTKVDSCSHILVSNGKTLAVSFGIKNRRGRNLNHFKSVPGKLSVNKSTYMQDYHPYPNMHAGMGKKPLMPYSPDCFRSRLPINGIVNGAANNRSYLQLGDKALISNKDYNSTYRIAFKWPRIVPISNSGICADMAKAAHVRMNSIG